MIWWWSFFLTTTVVLSKVLTAAVLQLFLEVRQALGEPGIGLPRQIWAVMKNLWHQRSYEGSMKSVPDDDLLKMLAEDLDPAHVKKLMQMKTDRRLCTREDRRYAQQFVKPRDRDCYDDAVHCCASEFVEDLARAEKDVRVDADFLVKRGMDPASAERLIERTSRWALGISTTTSATNRLMLLVAKQMEYLSREADRIQRKVRHRVDRAAQSADRVDVKHAKCAALAKRLRRAQQIPAGWTAHRDETGRRFLRHEERSVCTFFFFRMRRRHLAECNFDGAVSSRQVDAESPEWKWKSYVVRVACSFDGRELKGTALDLLEGDLVQVEAEVDNAWLYGHTARDFDLVGFIPKSYVEELGLAWLLVTLPSKQAERASVMEIFAASRGWLYGRHVGSSATSWFPENSLVEAPASGPSGPRYAAHGTASWTCGDLAGAPECDAPPDRPKARRSPICRRR
eukprot:g15392.t1